MVDRPLTRRHPRWEEFIERLKGSEGCNFTPEMTWTCFGGVDKRFSQKILADMGFSERAIQLSFAYFEDHGGYCDCEVVFNTSGDES